MNVFTYFSPDGPDLEAQLVPLWEESWRRQGWTPRVLTIRDARKHKEFEKTGKLCPELLAFANAGGGWYSSLWVINISFSPQQRRKRLEFFVGGLTWATRLGVKDLAEHPVGTAGPKFKIGKCVIGENLPLITCERCQSVEEAQQQIERCSQARKKN